MIIGLAGKFGAGKDAAADVMVRDYGFVKMSFAAPLRAECTDAIASKKYPSCIPADLRHALLSSGVKASAVYDKPTSPVIRHLLQWWGTDYRRTQDPDYWMKAAAVTMDKHPNLVVSDVRFPNEAQAIKQRNGLMWLVIRPELQLTVRHTHKSEEFVDAYQDWDLVLQNTGTLEAFEQRTVHFVERELSLARLASDLGAPPTSMLLHA